MSKQIARGLVLLWASALLIWGSLNIVDDLVFSKNAHAHSIRRKFRVNHRCGNVKCTKDSKLEVSYRSTSLPFSTSILPPSAEIA